MKKVKFIIYLILLVVFFAGGCYVGYQAHDFSIFQKGKVTYTSEIIKENIKDISNLVTLEDTVTATAKLDEDSIKIIGTNYKIPFTKKSLVVRYDGVIKMGTDLAKSDVWVIDNGKTPQIKVELAKCKFTDVYIDAESWEYQEQKNGVFNRLKPEDVTKLQKQELKRLKKLAKDGDYLDRANENAIEQVKEFLEEAYPDADVVVEVH